MSEPKDFGYSRITEIEGDQKELNRIMRADVDAMSEPMNTPERIDLQGGKNTEREIYRRIEGDFYSPSIAVTADDNIVLKVGGLCVGKKIEDWHALSSREAPCTNWHHPDCTTCNPSREAPASSDAVECARHVYKVMDAAPLLYSKRLEAVNKAGAIIQAYGDARVASAKPVASSDARECASRVRNAINNSTGFEADIIQTYGDARVAAETAQTRKDYEEWGEDVKRLTRELDVALNGEENAAKQASLCDVVAQVLHGHWKFVDGAHIAAKDAEIARLRGALENVIRHDVSVAGGRGKGPFKHGGEHPKLGVNPNKGARWATPTEIARAALATPAQTVGEDCDDEYYADHYRDLKDN